MYSKRHGLIIAFHGCDAAVRDLIITEGQGLKSSTKPYEWLGYGAYFWENNHQRALEFAEETQARNHIQNPAVLGAVIDLGHCLDLTDSRYLYALKKSYDVLVSLYAQNGALLPQNHLVKSSGDILKRVLDCKVIENLHFLTAHSPFDTVRGAFIEGAPLYEGACINQKNHIQICIRNPNCVKAFFIPRAAKDWNGKIGPI